MDRPRACARCRRVGAASTDPACAPPADAHSPCATGAPHRPGHPRTAIDRHTFFRASDAARGASDPTRDGAASTTPPARRDDHASERALAGRQPRPHSGALMRPTPARVLRLTLLLALLWTPALFAQTAAEAVRRGVALRREGNDAAALAAFVTAWELEASGQTAAHLGTTHQALGHWMEAEQFLVRALQPPHDAWIVRSPVGTGRRDARNRGNHRWPRPGSRRAPRRWCRSAADQPPPHRHRLTSSLTGPSPPDQRHGRPPGHTAPFLSPAEERGRAARHNRSTARVCPTSPTVP